MFAKWQLHLLLEIAYMTSSIIGATSLEQLKTNIDAINIELSQEVLADIEEVRRKYPVPF